MNLYPKFFVLATSGTDKEGVNAFNKEINDFLNILIGKGITYTLKHRTNANRHFSRIITTIVTYRSEAPIE